MKRQATLAGAAVVALVCGWLLATGGAGGPRPLDAAERAISPSLAPAPQVPVLEERVAHTPERTLDVDLPTSDAKFEVRVVDSVSGEPVSGVRVTVYETSASRPSLSVAGHRGDLVRSPVTDKQGSAFFELPSRRPLRLALRGPAVASIVVAPFVAGEERFLEVPVEPSDKVQVSGRIIDRETGAPVVGAEVRRVRNGPGPRAWSAIGSPLDVTDEEGAYTFIVPGQDTIDLQIDAAGYGPATFLSGPRDASRERTLSIARAATLKVIVDDEEAGSWVARVRTSPGELAVNGDFLAGPDLEWHGAVVNGEAWIEHLPASSRLEVELLSEGIVRRRAARAVRLEPGEERVLELDLGRGLTLKGRLQTAEGEGIADQEVWLVAAPRPGPLHLANPAVFDAVLARAVTRDEGHFELRDVPAGEWAIGPAPPTGAEAAWAPIGQWFRVPSEATELSLDVIAEPALYLEGQVMDEDGEPVANAAVTYRALDDSRPIFDRAQEDGSFRLGPVGPGPFEVAALPDRAKGHAGSSPRFVSAGPSIELTVKDGVRLRLAGIRKDGRVVPLQSGLVTSSRTLVASHGSYYGGLTLELGPIEPGVHGAFVSTRDGWCGVLHPIEVTAGHAGPERWVPLERGAEVELTNAGKERLEVRAFAGEVIVATGGIDPGAGVVWTVPVTDSLELEYQSAEGELLVHRTATVQAKRVRVTLPRRQ